MSSSSSATDPRKWLEDLKDIKSSDAKVDWLIDGLLQSQGLAVLYGPAGIGKTFLSLSMALSLAAYERTPQGELRGWSGSFDLKPRRKAQVVYWIGEGGVSIRSRIKGWLQTQGAKENAPFHLLDQFTTANTLMDETKTKAFFGKLPAAIQAEASESAARTAEKPSKPSIVPLLLVIDTLSATHPAFDENDARSAGAIMQNCRFLIDLFTKEGRQLSILIIHHSTKRGGMRGHSKLIGDPDTVLSVGKIGRAGERALVLRTEKQRAAEAKGALFLSYDSVTLQFQRRGAVSAPDRPKRGPKPDAKLRILKTIAHEMGQGGFTNEDLREKVGQDLALVTVAKLTKTLFDKGLLDREKTNSGKQGNTPNAYAVKVDDFLTRAHAELGLEVPPSARPATAARVGNQPADGESPTSVTRKTMARKTTVAPDKAKSQ